MLFRSKNTYNTFVDLLIDIKFKTSVDNRQLNILTGLSFFDDFGKNKYLLEVIKIFNLFHGKKPKKQINKKDLVKLNITENMIEKYSGKITNSLYKELDIIGLINELIKKIDNKSMSIKEQIRFELEYLEYIIYTNPKAPENMYYVTECKFYKDKTKPYLMLYNLKSGNTLKSKITSGKSFVENPFKIGNVIHVKEFSERNKMKKIGGEWVRTEEKEKVVKEWTVY